MGPQPCRCMYIHWQTGLTHPDHSPSPALDPQPEKELQMWYPKCTVRIVHKEIGNLLHTDAVKSTKTTALHFQSCFQVNHMQWLNWVMYLSCYALPIIRMVFVQLVGGVIAKYTVRHPPWCDAARNNHCIPTASYCVSNYLVCRDLCIAKWAATSWSLCIFLRMLLHRLQKCCNYRGCTSAVNVTIGHWVTSCRIAVGGVQQGISALQSSIPEYPHPFLSNICHLFCCTLLLYKLSSWPLHMHVCTLCRLHCEYVDSKHWKSGGSRGLITR